MSHRVSSAPVAAVWRSRALVLPVSLVLAMGAACNTKKNEAPPEPAPVLVDVAGLDAVPVDATALIGANVASLKKSWLVRRAVAQMFRRDPELKERIDKLIADCRLDPDADLESFLIAMKGDAGTGPALMVATGRFVEADLASCVGQSMAEGGGGLTVERVEGRAVYHAHSPKGGSVWFTISAPRTLVVATAPDWLASAVGTGDKIASAPAMAALLGSVDRKADLWAVGELDPAVGAGLLEVASGAVASPPRALFVQADLKAGAGLVLGAVMASPDDANALVSLIKSQLALGALAAQRYGLGPLVSKLGVDSGDKTVYLRMTLSEDEVKDVLARIDTSAGATQNSAEN